ncbi:ATP-binding protein [Streptacidiphilus rugosus]|uniref:ATP-binding protein n=1 Tax=Streptacidiphilus rugosus TaxID=405783 RepID=UPI0018DEC24C|nr:tetratricopeptide repeat protein [Streptacidiphilus rugosus]
MGEQHGTVPDPDRAADLAEFIGALGELRVSAGMPSYRALAKRVGPRMRPPRVMSPNTLVDAFRPERRRLDLDLVVAIVGALGEDEAAVDRWRESCLRVHRDARTQAPAGAERRRRAVDGAPAELSADLTDFTGRVSEAEELVAALGTPPSGPAAPVVLSAISGAGGMGKTTLAVHVAHRVLRGFPDGQLQADFHGTEAVPTAPHDVLARFLRSLGVAPARIPVDPDERAALYRSLLAQRRVLILLDNVRDAAQVRPLLPGAGPSRVLVTSRSALPGLDGALRITLGALGPDESSELFTNIVGHPVVSAEPDAVQSLLEICAGLPLAVRIAASRLATGLHPSVGELARRLADERSRLDELTVEDRAIRTTFSVSYRGLPEDQARAFRLLTVSDCPSFTVPAAAALLALPADVTRRLLDALVDIHLLQSSTPGRYVFHDLLRLFAAECAQRDETPAARDAAMHRQLRWHLHTSAAASRRMNPSRRHVIVEEPGPGWRPLDFDDFDAALAWFEAERTNLGFAVAQAARTGCYEIAWKLPITMWDLFHKRLWQQDGIRCYESALAGAEALQDRAAEAWVLVSLSSAYREALRLGEAADCLDRALTIRSGLGDLQGQGSCLINLGYVYTEMGRAAEAADVLERAVRIFQGLGHPAGEAAAHTNLGLALQQLGDHPAAVGHHRRALAINLRTPDRFAVGKTLTNLSVALFQLGSLDEAADQARRAVEVTRDTGNSTDEGHALDALGQVHAARGQGPLAHRYWREAYVILDSIGHPHAADVHHRLTSPTG